MGRHYNPLRRRLRRDGGGGDEDASSSSSSETSSSEDEESLEAFLALNESARRRGRMARNASMRRDAYDQFECLRRVHAEREIKAAFAAEMEDIKRRLTELDAIENACSVSQVEAERAAERAAAAMAAALDAQLDDDDVYVSFHVWSNHESSWLSFEKRANDALEARVREDGGTDGVDIERVDDPDGERIEMVRLVASDC